MRWVKALEASAGLRVLTPSAPDLLRQLEGAVSFGCPVLLADVGEELDASLEPLLAKAVTR